MKIRIKNKIDFLIFLGVVALVLALGVLDTATGYEISFSIFYTVPVLLAARRLGSTAVTVIAVLSAAVWLVSDLLSGHHYSHFLIPLWNSVMRLGFFLTIAYFARGFWHELKLEKELARKDSMTGVSNSRRFTEIMETEINRSVRFGRSMALAYIDIDNFKRVNDSFGHDQGDLVLRVVAQTILNHIRAYDSVARLGGDEFAILFPETNEEQARAVIKKIQKELILAVKPRADFVSFSFGVAVFTRPVFSVQEMIKKADALMYQIKNTTKNGAIFETVG
ncbi:MAG: GGDEF domain-containing protein [Candidatus Omnitrophica bacterium]|nr:GGDEF domain-containing protein [Candidatus Omnitrophota bacterium]